MTKSGKTFAIFGILWKVFIVVIIMHPVCITIQFTIAGTVNKRHPFRLIKNQIPGYTTALGTQSSAATIPVNLECAKAGDPDGPICAIMVALYITQDSFGTACNISGDNAIGVIVDTIYKKFFIKEETQEA